MSIKAAIILLCVVLLALTFIIANYTNKLAALEKELKDLKVRVYDILIVLNSCYGEELINEYRERDTKKI